MSTSLKYASLRVGLALLVATPALAMTNSEFLKKAVQGDNSEVALGRLALTKARDPGVKAFAQTLIDDHSKAKAQVMTVSTRMGVAMTDDMAPEAKTEMTRLEPLSGAAFDKAFVAYMVDDHEKDVADFKKEASSSKGDVQTLASENLPTLEKHLDMAKSLAGKL